MTRDERLAQQEATARQDLDTKKTRLRRIQAQQRAEAKKALDRRRYAVGKLAEEAGWFWRDDATLVALFRVMRPLLKTADPVWLLQQMIAASGIIETQADVAALMQAGTTLVLVREDGQPLTADVETEPCRENRCSLTSISDEIQETATNGIRK